MSAVALAHALDGPAQASPLLLGGSLGSTRAMWEPQLRALSARTRTVAFDLRGHGESPVPDGPYTMAELGEDVLALMDRLEFERVSYCGLSIGAMLGLWLAVNAPERIGRLILICTAAHFASPETYSDRARAVLQAGTPEVVADAVVGRWFTRDWAADHPDEVAYFRQMIAATPATGYAGCCRAIAGHDVRAGLASIRAPTLVIAAAQDEALPPDYGREIAAGIPGARFELLDPAAHLANVERAADINDLIAQHLGEER